MSHICESYMHMYIQRALYFMVTLVQSLCLAADIVCNVSCFICSNFMYSEHIKLLMPL